MSFLNQSCDTVATFVSRLGNARADTRRAHRSSACRLSKKSTRNGSGIHRQANIPTPVKEPTGFLKSRWPMLVWREKTAGGRREDEGEGGEREEEEEEKEEEEEEEEEEESSRANVERMYKLERNAESFIGYVVAARVRPSVSLQMKTLNNLVAGCKSRRGSDVNRYTPPCTAPLALERGHDHHWEATPMLPPLIPENSLLETPLYIRYS
uniref:Uncharacterized protein n=1 Tax=Vespula pensylvanica TaxID=30213 RepID=A0A834P5K5_VESPE|nr:hypothetical protein H0235_005780 [Vespula pensylvanica]